MAETITIPSPSLCLTSPDPSPTATQPPGKKDARRPKPPPKAAESTGITKRKQSKSRNGCITCKAKRLKCDETKDSCKQCARRGVVCGGYKKDFKWRPFQETTTFSSKPQAKTRKDSPTASTPLSFHSDGPPVHKGPRMTGVVNSTMHNPYMLPQSSAPVGHAFHPTCTYAEPPYLPPAATYQPSPYGYAPPPISPVDQFAPASVDSLNSMFEGDSMDTRPTRTTAASSIASGQSPRLVDLLLPGTDLTVPPEEYMSYRSQFPDFYEPTGFTPPAEQMDEDDIEEIPRNFEHEAWVMRLPSPTPSSSSSSSSDSNVFPFLNQPQFSTNTPEMLTRRFDRDTCGILSVRDGPTENPWRTLVWPLARDCPALYHAIASMTSFHHSGDSPVMRIQGIDHMRNAVHALASRLEHMRVDAAISTTLVLALSESWDQHISTGINHIKGAKILIDRALVQHSQSPIKGDELVRLKFLCNIWIYMDVIARLTSSDDDESNDFDTVSDAVYMNGGTDSQLDPLMGCASTLFPIIGRVANLVRKVRRVDSNSPRIISQATELKAQLDGWVPPSHIDDPEDETTSPVDSIKTATAYQYATMLYLHQAVPEVPSLSSAQLAKKALCELAAVHTDSRSVIVHIYPLMAAGCEAVDQETRQWVQDRWATLAARMKLGLIEKCVEVTREVWNRRDAYAAQSLTNAQERSDSMSSMAPSPKREFSSFSDSISPSLQREFSGFSDSMSSVTPSLKREFSDNSDTDSPFCWLDVGNKRRVVSGADFYGNPQPFPIKPEPFEIKRRPDLGTEELLPEFTVKGRLHWLGVMNDWKWEVLLG